MVFVVWVGVKVGEEAGVDMDGQDGGDIYNLNSPHENVTQDAAR